MLSVTVCVVMAGCASDNTRNQSDSVDALYTQLDQAVNRWNAARASAMDAGQNQKAMQNALDSIKAAASRCDQTDGCDMQRFVATYNGLLRGRSATLAAGHPTPVADDGGDEPADAAVAEAGRTKALLHGHKLSDLIAMSGPVKLALENWLTRRRPQLMEAYDNYRYLRYLMWPQFKKADLPEAILFGVVAQESHGKVHAVSRSGAKGPMQFMYATGKRFGLNVGGDFDERFDPAASARAAADFLNEQLQKFNDNLALVLAAYNAGSGHVERSIAGDKNAELYDTDVYFKMPRETRNYVPRVLAAAWLFQHPDSYNLHFPQGDIEPGHVKLARQASLDELTVCLGQAEGQRTGWYRTLRNLNPRLDPDAENEAGTRINMPQKLEADYAKQCTDGPWPILAADLHSGEVPKPPPSGLPRHYTVASGDTLSSIVRRLGCSSVHEIAHVNDLQAPRYTLRAGQTLTLPRCY